MQLGIAGDQSACVALAGTVAGGTAQRLGIASLDPTGTRDVRGALGLAGPNCRNLVDAAQHTVVAPAAPTRRQRLGARAQETWDRVCWFSDFLNLVKPCRAGGVEWRTGREAIFGPHSRQLDLKLDSCGFGREIARTAPRWAHEFAHFVAAVALVQPSAYCAFDYPLDATPARTLESLCELARIFPSDVTNGRLWPAFSARWTWDADARLTGLPAWATLRLTEYMPLTRPQQRFQQFSGPRLEAWGRLAVANAYRLAAHADFQWMVRTFGRCMIGGLVKGPVPRMARGLYLASLQYLFPDAAFWLLGQASGTVLNSLQRVPHPVQRDKPLAQTTHLDGSWWIHQSRCEAIAYVEDGLITSLAVGQGRTQAGGLQRETFFTWEAMLASHITSLAAAVAGLVQYPLAPPLPIRWDDVAALERLRDAYRPVQLALFPDGDREADGAPRETTPTAASAHPAGA